MLVQVPGGCSDKLEFHRGWETKRRYTPPGWEDRGCGRGSPSLRDQSWMLRGWEGTKCVLSSHHFGIMLPLVMCISTPHTGDLGPGPILSTIRGSPSDITLLNRLHPAPGRDHTLDRYWAINVWPGVLPTHHGGVRHGMVAVGAGRPRQALHHGQLIQTSAGSSLCSISSASIQEAAPPVAAPASRRGRGSRRVTNSVTGSWRHLLEMTPVAARERKAHQETLGVDPGRLHVCLAALPLGTLCCRVHTQCCSTPCCYGASVGQKAALGYRKLLIIPVRLHLCTTDLRGRPHS
ncbi:unnamed protein product [Arctogadus glacialis]